MRSGPRYAVSAPPHHSASVGDNLPRHPRRHVSDLNDRPRGRYVRILETVAAARTGLTLTEIAQELGLRAGAVHRLVRNLADLDLLREPAGSKSYLPGPRLQNLLHLTMDMTGYDGI